MRVIDNIPLWKSLRPTLVGTVGLIPTMGALHEGHLSLVRRAREENDFVVVWVFVNPKQFNEGDDFANYPRNLEQDMGLLEAEKVDFILAPKVEDVYPPGFQTYVHVEELTAPLEGTHRPGHFRGVTTVVAKMLCLTQCHKAYFGQKDAQQSLVVRRMVKDLDMLTEIVICPTVREEDGLAMSSRNVHLSREDRRAATILYKALVDAENAVRCGERNGDELRERMISYLQREPRIEVEYVSVADPVTLQEYEKIQDEVLISLAVRVGETRLIDNLPLSVKEK